MKYTDIILWTGAIGGLIYLVQFAIDFKGGFAQGFNQSIKR